MDTNPSPVGPRDSTRVPRYAGIASFSLLPGIDEVDSADIAVVGVPFDTGVSFRPGARFGPSHVREASRLIRPYNPALDVYPFSIQQVVDAGDFSANPFKIDEAVEEIYQQASGLMRRADRIVAIGGDHTIAYPMLRAVAEKHGPVAVLHADAHLDTWDTQYGVAVTHGTPFRKASQDGFIDLTASAHLGIRGPIYGHQDLVEDAELGFEVTTTDFVAEQGLAATVDRIHKRLGDRPVYVSVDIDVLDPAHAPGTGTPEAGGMTSRELLTIIRSMNGLNIVGADVVEVAPAYDHAQITAVAASHVIYELISAMGAPAPSR